MRININMWRFGYTLIASGISFSAFAAEGPLPIHLSVAEEYRQDSNANRSSIADNELSEVQLSSSVLLNGRFDQYEKVRANLDYQWSKTDYREDSQPSNPILTGNARAEFGAGSDFYLLSVNHSSSQVLLNPSESDISSNRSNRSIFGSSLKLKTKPAKPNVFSFTVGKNVVNYDDLESNDTDRMSAELNYARKMNPLTTAGAQLTYSDVSYPNFQFSDYDNTLVFVYLQRQLKELSYFVATGVNQTSSSFSDRSSPYVQLNASYTSGVSNLSLSLSRDVTDSSFGSGGAPATVSPAPVSTIPGGSVVSTSIIDGSLLVRDHIQRDSVSLGYRTSSVCERCSFNAQLGYLIDDYFNSSDQNSKALSVRTGISYRAYRSLTLSLGAAHTEYEFINRVDANDYAQNDAQFSLTWRGKNRLAVAGFVGAKERNYEQSGSYSGEEFGLSLSYQLF